MTRFDKHVFVCTNQRAEGHPRGCCDDLGGSAIRFAFVEGLKKRGLKDIVRANKTGCLDACELGPAVVIYPLGIWYLHVTPGDVEEIVETSIMHDGVVNRLVAGTTDWDKLRNIRAAERTDKK
ncbi:ferredoxin [Candidatus Neomarinimicrobiota bacterium]